MITPRPHNQRNSSYQYQHQYGYASNNNTFGHGADPQLPFPPAIPPPPLPPTAGGSSSWGGYNSSNNNKKQTSTMVPGGTWQTAAIYSGAYTSNQFMGSKDAGSPEYQQHFGTTSKYQNETVPVGHQVPPYIANKETFSHQRRESSLSRGDHNDQQQQLQRPRQTASGLEVHAMQLLVSSAKTRFAPSSNNNNNNNVNNNNNIANEIENELIADGNTNNYNHHRSSFYEHDQDYFAANNQQNQIQSNVEIAEQHARREQLLNSHRESGGVAFERKLRNQRERNINSGRGAVVPSVIGIDGTFRRTQTPNSLAGTNNNNNNNKSESSKLAHLRKEGNERYIPLSQAQTSLLVKNKNGLRPSSAGISRNNSNNNNFSDPITVKSRLKGEAPDLKRSLAEGFAMRFQPEQIEQMQLPESVGQAALEISRYRTAAGGFDNTRRQNNQAPDSSYINGIGDMFTKMKGQYLQMQKLGGGGGGKTESPIPRNPQQQLFKRPGGHLEGGGGHGGITSPLKAGGGQVFIAGGNNGNAHNNNQSRNNNNNNATSIVNATPLYSIAGTGAFRDQTQTTSYTGFSPRERNTNPNNNFSPTRNKSTKELVRFEPPQPSARALALRAELDVLEAQWKELHSEQQQHNNSNANNYQAGNNVTSVSPEPLHPQNQQNTRDQVLSRINAVLR